MRFGVEHRFAAPADDVQAAMVDPGFLESLRSLPGVAPPTVLERHDDASIVRLRVRYEFVGSLPAVARRVLGADRIVWVQESTVDLARHHTDFTIVPQVHAERFDCAGTYQLIPDGEGTRREIAGDLRVRVPLLAARAERAIAGGLVDRLEVEADLLRQWLGRAGDQSGPSAR